MIHKRNFEPSVTIIIRAYNASRYIRQTLKGIICQKYSNFIVLIIDDHSSDNTVEIVKNFNDPRLIVIKNSKNIGAVATGIKGVKLSKTKYTAIMDSDDIPHCNWLSETINFLDNHLDYGVVACRVKLIDSKGKYRGLWPVDQRVSTWEEIKSQLPKSTCITNSGTVFRTPILKRYSYESWDNCVEDYDLLLRLASDGIKIFKIPKILVKYRVHNQARSHQKKLILRYAKTRINFFVKKLRHRSLSSFDILVIMYLIPEIIAIITYNFLSSLGIIKPSLKH